MMDTAALLKSYPRTRPPLSEAHRASYVEHYRANRSGEGLSAIVMRLEAWMHRELASGSSDEILEIGAGNLNHLPYVSARAYDVVEPFHELWEDSRYRARVRKIFRDLAEIPAGSSYDEVLSIATVEHLTDLPGMIAQSALLLRPGGTWRAAFPSEGGFLWGLAWRCTTGVAYRLRRRLSYAAIMRHEHLNSAPEIIGILRYFFNHVSVRRFPLPAHHLSFYAAAAASEPRRDRCLEFLGCRCEVAR